MAKEKLCLSKLGVISCICKTRADIIFFYIFCHFIILSLTYLFWSWLMLISFTFSPFFFLLITWLIAFLWTNECAYFAQYASCTVQCETYLISSGAWNFVILIMLGFMAERTTLYYFYAFFICMPYLCREVLQGQGYFGLAPVFELKLLAMGW